MLLDTSGLLAAYDRSSRSHESAREVLCGAEDALVLSPFVLAELDYLVRRRIGTGAELALLREVARGAYVLAVFGAEDVADAVEVLERYRNLGVGLADASIVVLASRYKTRRVLTLDERHFRALRPLDGGSFELLPADH